MKKTLVSLSLVLVLLLASVIPAYAVTTMYVNTPNRLPLNIRAEPSKKAKKIGYKVHGEEIGVDHIDGAWAEVVCGSQDGYVMAQFLSYTKPSTKPKKQTVTASNDSYASFKKANYDVVVKPTHLSGFVNLRWTPSTSARVQAKYFNGETLHVIAESRNWLQVLDMDTMTCGFMMKKFTTPVVAAQ